MKLGMFSMPLHRPEKPWKQALNEDRQAVILADKLGFSEVWIGEHFTSKVEQIPSAMMFFASLLNDAPNIRFGTGVVNLPHHDPIVVAAESAMFDQLSGGRLMLGIGPGGLPSDAEMFGHTDVAERNRMAAEAAKIIVKAWTEDGPFEFNGDYWTYAITDNVWHRNGVGMLCKPAQQPHPPMAMAMVSPNSGSAKAIAANDWIPISANFVSVADAASHWPVYAETRASMGKPADPAIWRFARNILVTEDQALADDLKADPDGVFAFYFRYLRTIRRVSELKDKHDAPAAELNEIADVGQAIDDCIIAGTADRVLEELVAVADQTGPFGTLMMAGHDWDETEMWPNSMRLLAEEVAPRLGQHVDAKLKRAAE